MPASEQKRPPGIFIGYRRSDTPDAVGQDFRGHLNDIVGNCAAVLAIIDPKWTDIRMEQTWIGSRSSRCGVRGDRTTSR